MTDLNSGTGPSPFEGSAPTTARRAVRIAVSMGVIAVAILTAFILTRDGADVTAPAGHEQMAPGGDSAVPVTLDAQGARRIGVTFAAVSMGPMTSNVRSCEAASGSQPSCGARASAGIQASSASPPPTGTRRLPEHWSAASRAACRCT